MASTSRFPCHGFNIDWRQCSVPARVDQVRIVCNSTLPRSPGAEESRYSMEEESEAPVVLVERNGSGISKRYIVENDLRITTILEDHLSKTKLRDLSNLDSDADLSWLPRAVKDFVLPAGFPDSVSDDYLEYMLLQFPTNVTGWICNTLVTSSLLKAVGVGSFSGTTAAASAAAIRWVFKDGIGAIGRLLIGGRFGNLFDDDPRQWRLYADFIGSTGSIFDLSTQLYPAYFLPLASLGNLAKAVGRGLRDPSFRVIQYHLATSGNMGDVTAKEEVWDVSAELVGLALGILALDSPGISSSYPTLATTWLILRLIHLWLRYKSLSVLRFDTINLKRARILVNSYLSYRKIPGIRACNEMENVLVWERFSRPRITFGVSLEEMVTGNKRGSVVKMLIKLYAEEKYFLVVNLAQKDFEIFVSFKEGATSLSVLRSLWQSYYLHQNWSSSADAFNQLELSLIELKNGFDDFLLLVEEADWDINQITLRVPKDILITEQFTI